MIKKMRSKIHGNLGKICSKNTRKLISDKLKGKMPKNIDKIAGWNKGKKCNWAKTGVEHQNWNGGKITHKGYIMIFSPNHPYPNQGKYVYEHRLVVEKKIGRYLTKEEVVHHLNENKQDNRTENLMLFKNNAAHMKFHTKIRQIGFTTPIRRQIKNRWDEWIKKLTA